MQLQCRVLNFRYTYDIKESTIINIIRIIADLMFFFSLYVFQIKIQMYIM